MARPGISSPITEKSLSTVNAADWASASYPLGAHLVGDTATFAVYSKHATRVVLEIFDASIGADATLACEMVKSLRTMCGGPSRGCWNGTLYGFRCWGPNWPFDPKWKLGNSSAGFIADVDANGNVLIPISSWSILTREKLVMTECARRSERLATIFASIAAVTNLTRIDQQMAVR